MSSPDRPNLFKHATSELSQDAFLCWLLEWADASCANEDPLLHRTALRFVADLASAAGLKAPEQAARVEVLRQKDSIDIAARIGEGLVILIEDKIDARIHGDQLERYLAIAEENWPGSNIAAIYLKTGDQSDYAKAESHKFVPYLRSRLLAILTDAVEAGVDHDVLVDFHRRLAMIEEETQAFRSKAIAKEWGGRMWSGFFMALKEAIGDGGWGYVANPTGGFMGFWWAFSEVDGGEVYLQIQEADLYARVVVTAKDTETRKTIRDREMQRLLTKPGAEGYGLRRPKRRSVGGTMAIAEAGEYRMMNDDGTLDLEATADYLQKVASLLKRDGIG